jgi:hypothetical protein
MKPEQLTQLEKSIIRLDGELRRLVADDELKRLLDIIHKPGWTTVAEATFAMGIVDAMTAKAETLHRLKSTLISGASLVGQK